MDDLGFFERIGALLIMSVVVILFLSIGVAVIAIGVAVGLHLVEPIGDLPGWAGRQVADLLRWVLDVARLPEK